MTMLHAIKSIKERFEESYIIEPNSGCWIWIKSYDGFGYGVISIRGKKHKASRVCFELFKSHPGKMLVCHKCDTPSCVNPKHLFLGTALDNARDRENKGRGKSGIRSKQKTHCKRGHEFSEQNIYWSRHKNRKSLARACKKCRNFHRKKSNGLLGR